MSGNPSTSEVLSQITVVTVNYNSKDVIGKCVEPLLGAKEVIVVDNCSHDDSVAMIEREFPSVRIIRNTINIGNGGGLNAGANLAETPYILMCDPDAVIEPEEVVKLYNAIQEYETAAFVAPILYTPRFGADIWWMGAWEHVQRRDYFDPAGPFCSWFLAGTVMLFRTDAWKDIGGFDENIFLYCEDFDLNVRIRQKGYSMVLIPDARADHLNSRSAPPSVKMHWRKDWNFAWSHLYVTEKHEGKKRMRQEAFRLLRKHGPKSLFYVLVLDRKRFIRDFAFTHGIISYLMGRPAPRPN